MPELCGVCSTHELSPDVREKWARMRDEMVQSNDGEILNEEYNCSAVAAISHHCNDAATIIREKESSHSCVLIGIDTEVYNASDLSDSFKKISPHGFPFFQNFKPPFAACLLDKKSHASTLIVDPYGLLPVYYAIHDRMMVFSTKLTPLLKSGLVPWKLDGRSAIDFFTYRHLTGDRTLADTVRVLSPGTIAQFDDSELHLNAYVPTVPEVKESYAHTPDKVAERLYNEISSSVAASMSGRSRVAITLSGGLDSRALLGCAIKHRSDLRTYTFGSPECRDVKIARRLSDLCGLKHTVVPLDGSYLEKWLDHGIYTTGGMVSCDQYHILQLAEILKTEADVVLDGLAGDFMSGGNLPRKIFNMGNIDLATSLVYDFRACGWITNYERDQIFEKDFLERNDYDPKDAVRKHFDNLQDCPIWWGSHRFDLLERQRRFIQFGPHQLRSLVEVQTPFYSGKLIDLMKSLPSKYLIGQRIYRRMHIKHLPKTAAVPEAKRNLPLAWPRSVRYAKHVFDALRRRLPDPIRKALSRDIESPYNYANWFRTVLRPFIEGRLLEDSTGFEGIVRQKEVKRIINEHMRGINDYTYKIAILLTFDAWLKSLKVKK